MGSPDRAALIIADRFPDLPELGPDSSGRNPHGDGLHRADFIVREAVFSGNAKEVLHSRVASYRERCRQLNHDGCFRVQQIILDGGFVERFEFLLLALGQHEIILS